MSHRTQNYAAELKLRAERKIGGLLNEEFPYGGNRRSSSHDDSLKMSDIGVNFSQSTRYRLENAVPEEKFTEWLLDTGNGEGELTSAGLQQLARDLRRTPSPPRTPDIPEGTFGVLYADPPWRYEHSATNSREIENQYPTMSLDEICALEHPHKCSANDAVLFLWATSPKLTEAVRVMDMWGFNYRTCMVWVKDRIGMGWYARQRHELLLIGTKGNPPVPVPETRPDSVITAPRQEHSRKPEQLYGIIEAMYPGIPKIELFARQRLEGWESWGHVNESR